MKDTPEEQLTERQKRAWKANWRKGSSAKAAAASVKACAAKRAAAKLDEVLGPVEEEP